MLVGGVLFAVMATFVGAAHARDPDLSTFVTSAVRSSVNLVAIVILAGGSPRALLGDGRRSLWARGVLGGFSLLTYFGALSRVGVGEAAFLNQTSAVWVAILAPLVLRERTSSLVWVAVVGSLVGVGLLAHPRADMADLVGRALGLASGAFAAGAYLSIRRASASNTGLTIVFYFTLVSSLASLSLAAGLGVDLPEDPLVWAFLCGSGLAATFAQLIMTAAYRIGRAAPVAAAGAASPLLNTLLAWQVLGQVPDAWAWAGMAVLSITGIALPFAAERRR